MNFKENTKIIHQSFYLNPKDSNYQSGIMIVQNEKEELYIYYIPKANNTTTLNLDTSGCSFGSRQEVKLITNLTPSDNKEFFKIIKLDPELPATKTMTLKQIEEKLGYKINLEA